MKVELKEAKVELEVRDGKSNLYINGHCVALPKVVGIKLIFGEDVSIEVPDPPQPAKSKQRSFGCQTAASKRKLSASLKKYHAKRRRKEREEEKAKSVKPSSTKPILSKPTTKKAVPKHLNGKSHLNGASTHY
jgi:hypothetical protein